MLDEKIKGQLRGHGEKITRPVEIVASVDEGAASGELRDFLADIKEASPMISVLFQEGGSERKPSFSIARSGGQPGPSFAGIPLGHEFSSLVLALLQMGGHPVQIEPALAARIAALEGDYVFETYVSLSCHNCADAVQALNAMASINPRVKATAIDGGAFPEEAERREVMSVPAIFLNGKPFAQGRSNVEDIMAKLDAGGAKARPLSEKGAFDVLIIGGGPAGAAGAIYAARKGVKTGVLAERFGGQTLDTLAIENYVSVSATEGPRFAADLERHVRDYEVDVMGGRRAASLIPGGPGKLARIVADDGSELRAKTVILAPGARWRELGVPGEGEYRNRGVAYCPHCDGPLFKGKRVAVVGGGNSGVEAAIDLAGLAASVVLLEFGDALRADEVLIRKLKSLPNASVLLSARTTRVDGDGSKVTGLAYEERSTGEARRIDIDGVFVQIGLVPNTEWLRGAVELSAHGEIEVDARGRSSAEGIFAAGDATTAPFKQIIIAAGDGAKASLAAFEHMMRNSFDEE